MLIILSLGFVQLKLNWFDIKDLWFLGLGLLGAYGAYFTASQLMSTYAITVFHLSQSTGGLIAAVNVLAGIPGSITGSYIADRARRLKVVIIVPLLLLGVGMIVLPFEGLAGTWIIAILVGFCLIYGFAAWTASPGHYRDRIYPEDVATAEGLMLTFAAIGRFLVPIGFGAIVASNGFTWGWIFLGIVSLVFAVLGFAAREPLSVKETQRQEAPIVVERG
jgi:ACS family D-galactonate transporter-like MFS transporter